MPAASVKSILSRMRQLEIRTRRLVNDSLIGEYHSVFKGRGMDFDEVREYVPGDEVRSIDWNVTARAGRPFVKKYTEERELNLLLVVDISASGNFGSGDAEQARSGRRSGKPSGAIRHSQQRQGRIAALHGPRGAIHTPEKGPTPCAARGARDSLPHRRGPRYRYGEGARGCRPASASARGRVPDFRFSVERPRNPNPAAAAQGPQADESPA